MISMPRVVGLSLAVSPNTVFWTVGAVIVPPFNGEFGAWLFTHICQKVREGLFPPLANSYAPAPVSRIRGVVRIVASLLHSGPCVVKRVAAQVVGCIPFTEHGLFPTKTRGCMPSSQVLRLDRNRVAPAVALASPPGPTKPVIASPTYDREASESFSCEINHSHGRSITL